MEQVGELFVRVSIEDQFVAVGMEGDLKHTAFRAGEFGVVNGRGLSSRYACSNRPERLLRLGCRTACRGRLHRAVIAEQVYVFRAGDRDQGLWIKPRGQFDLQGRRYAPECAAWRMAELAARRWGRGDLNKCVGSASGRGCAGRAATAS